MQRRTILLVTLFVVVSVSATILTAFGIADYSAPVAMAQSQGTYIEASDDLANEFAQVVCSDVKANVNIQGTELTLKTKENVGGAIDELIYKRVDLINSFDHGRQLQYALSVNNAGECNNPTEGGSIVNGPVSSPSTSKLQASCKLAPNQLFTRTRMAYWLPAGSSSGGNFCNGNSSKTINTTNLSDYKISKIVTIGYEGNENIVRMVSRLKIPEEFNSANIEIPTIYLDKQYNKVYKYDLLTQDLVRIPNSETESTSSYLTFMKYIGKSPAVLSDGTNYVAIYSPRASTNGIFKFDLSDPSSTADGSKIQAIYSMGSRRADQVEYFESFVIVGGYNKVVSSLKFLLENKPIESESTGSVDILTCSRIAGWACNPVDPSEVVKIEVHTVDKVSGALTLVRSVDANQHSEPGVNTICNGSNKRFDVSMDTLLRGLDRNFVEVYAVNAKGQSIVLPNGSKKLTCE